MTITTDKVAILATGGGFAICGGVLAMAEKISASARLFELGMAVGAAFVIGGGWYVVKDSLDRVKKSKERAEITKRTLQVLLITVPAFIVCYAVAFWLVGITFKFDKDEQISPHGRVAQTQAASPQPAEEKKSGSPTETPAKVAIQSTEKMAARPEAKNIQEGDSSGIAIRDRADHSAGGQQTSAPANALTAGIGAPAALPSYVNTRPTTVPRAEEPVKIPAPAAVPLASPQPSNAPVVASVPQRTLETISLYGNDPRAICGIQQMKVRPSSSAKPSPTGWILYSGDFLASFIEQPLTLDKSFKINDCVATLRKIDSDRFEFEVLRQK